MNFPELCGTDDCPFQPRREESLGMPIGAIRRVAASDGDVDETKRNILKLAAVAGVLGIGAGGAVAGAIQYVQPPIVGLTSYPRVLLLDVDGRPLTLGKGSLAPTGLSWMTAELYLFNYPLRNEPNFLLNLAGAPLPVGGPPGAVGTPPTIVAYSAICQHLGCPAPAIAYYPPGVCPSNTPGGKSFYIHCSCHGSTYDVTNGASNLTGPAVLPLPQVILDVPTTTGPTANQIYAVGMTPGSPPVNGHLNTLQGDYGVGTTSQVATETPVHLCNFLG